MPNKIIITGASSGIGEQAAASFLRQGHEVLNLSRRPCPVNGVTNIACDLTSPDAEQTIQEQVLPWLDSNRPTVLVHNAAKLVKDSATTTTPSALREILEINVVTGNLLNYYLLPRMRPGSSVIYIGSTLAEKAVANTFSYVVSKHAVIGMMRATCQDLVGTGIHTVCICPGFTDTEMLRSHVPEDVLPALGEMSAYGRLIDPQEIAETIVWASNNPVINGAIIHANLGQIES